MVKHLGTIFLLFICFHISTTAQDNHYWWQKYGGESTLMAGSVIAGCRDNNAVFYNPGALGFIDDLSISVNATVYMAQLSRIFNGVGDGLHLKQWRYAYFPQMISGMLPFKNLERWRFGYTLLTRYNSYYRFNVLNVMKYDVLEEYSGEETYIGSYEYFNDLTEQWGGLGVSYKLSNIASIGVTTFVTYRNQFFQQTVSARSIPVSDTNYLLIEFRDYDNIRYINWKVLFKIGLALDFDKWKVGLTITTPSISVYGDADVYREVSFVNFDKISSNFTTGDLLAIDRQTFLPMHNKSPLSIGAGIRYHGKKSRIEIAGEYFFGIKTYQMIKAEGRPFIHPTELVAEDIQEEFNFLSIYDYANPVMNIGIGFEQILSETVDILCGFHTDFSFKRNEEETDGYVIPSSSWNLYHFAGGINYNMKSSRLTAGVNYYFGIQNNMNQIINFTDPKDYLGLTGEINDNAYVRIHGLSAVIGFTYFFTAKETSSIPF